MLDRNHLALHLGKLSRRLLVPADKERRRPEDNDCGGRRPAVFGALAVLCARQCSRPGRYGLRLERKLLAGICLIGYRRDIMSAELDAQPPNVAPSATIPMIRILLIPRPASIQAQPEGEGNASVSARALHPTR